MTQEDAEGLLGFRLTPGWSVREINRGGVLAGFVLQKGSEIHAWRNEAFSGKWIYGGELRSIFAHVRRNFGTVTTKVGKQNTTGQRFVSRLGFVKTGESAGCYEYELGESRYAATN